MLIAIMGEAFTKDNEISHIETLKSHLEFVIQNWWREPFSEKEMEKTKYLITAFNREEETEEKTIVFAEVDGKHIGRQ